MTFSKEDKMLSNWFNIFLKEYEEYLEKYEKDLDNASKTFQVKRNFCLHDLYEECHGSGKKENGELCIHFISCNCSKCSPGFMQETIEKVVV